MTSRLIIWFLGLFFLPLHSVFAWQPPASEPFVYRLAVWSCVIPAVVAQKK